MSDSLRPLQHAAYEPLHFEVYVELLDPRKALLSQLGEERIGIELLDVEHARAAPEPFGPHRGAQCSRNARREAHGLCARFAESLLVVAVVVNVVGAFLAVLDAPDRAAPP